MKLNANPMTAAVLAASQGVPTGNGIVPPPASSS